MPTQEAVKEAIDEQITNKTAAYSISNVDVGERLKDIVDLTLPKEEVIRFYNESVLIIDWTDERKQKFGSNADFIIETQDADGKYRRKYGLEIYPDDPDNTTFFHIDLGGGNQSGRLTIR